MPRNCFQNIFHLGPCEKDSFCFNCKGSEAFFFFWPYEDVSYLAPNALEAIEILFYSEKRDYLACGVCPAHCFPNLPGLDSGRGWEVETGRDVPTLVTHSLGPCLELSNRSIPLVTQVECSVISRAVWLDIQQRPGRLADAAATQTTHYPWILLCGSPPKEHFEATTQNGSEGPLTQSPVAWTGRSKVQGSHIPLPRGLEAFSLRRTPLVLFLEPLFQK